MAATGYTPISLYYSTTASAVPTAGNLANGELALNIADMKLYAKNSSGVVTLLASNASTTGVDSLSFGSTGLTPSTATTGAITVAGTLNVANGGTGKTSYTANGILYASGTGTLANGSALTFDGAILGLGVGNSSQGKFQVNQSLGTSTDSAIRITDNATTSLFLNNLSSGVSGLWSSGSLAFGVASGSFSEGMRLTSTGLGIGTSSPTPYARLTVDGTAGAQTGASQQVVISAPTTTAGQGAGIRFNAASGAKEAVGVIGLVNEASGVSGAMTFHVYNAGADIPEYMRLNSAGNLGLGVTPSASWANYKVLQIGEQGVISGYASGAGVLNTGANFYWDGSGYRYLTTNPASLYQQNAGAHNWRIAASGTAGTAISFTQAMTLNASAYLGLGNTNPVVNLDIGINDSTTKVIALRYSSIPLYLSGGFDGTAALNTFSSNAYANATGSGASWSSFGNTSYTGAAVQLATSQTAGEVRLLTASAINTAPTEKFRVTGTGAIGLSGANYGTAGQVLTSGGSGAAPTWSTPGGGGAMVKLATITASSSSSIDFTGFVDNTLYQAYQIYIGPAQLSTNTFLYIAIKKSGSWVYSGYNFDSNRTGGSGGAIIMSGNMSGYSTAQNFAYVVTFFNDGYPLSAGPSTNILWNGSYVNPTDGSAKYVIGSGSQWGTNADLEGIQFYPNAGNIRNGDFVLYGIKRT